MKLLVNITVPAIDESFDMLIPDFLPTKELVALISQAVEEMTNRKFKSSGDEFLCLAGKNILLNQDTTPEMYKLQNGDKLLLI